MLGVVQRKWQIIYNVQGFHKNGGTWMQGKQKLNVLAIKSLLICMPHTTDQWHSEQWYKGMYVLLKTELDGSAKYFQSLFCEEFGVGELRPIFATTTSALLGKLCCVLHKGRGRLWRNVALLYISFA